MATAVAKEKEKVTASQIPLVKIVANTAQSRGMGVLSHLAEAGYGVFQSQEGQDDKAPLWTMLLSSDVKVKKHATELIDTAEPSIAKLAHSIHENGQLQDVGVRPYGEGMYDVIFGMRRLLAMAYNVAKHGNDAPAAAACKVYPAGDKPLDLLFIALTENDDREDESPIDKALTYQRLVKEGDLKPIDIGRRIGMSDQYVRNYIKLLDSKIQDKRAEIHAGDLSVDRALKLLQKRKESTTAEGDRTGKENGGRYRLPSVKNIEKIYNAPSKPAKMDDEEWQLWTSPDVRKLLAYRLGFKFSEWSPGPGYHGEETNGEAAGKKGKGKKKGAKAEPADESKKKKTLRLKRETANRLLINLGKTGIRQESDEVVKNHLENIVNLVEDDQKMETPALQKVLDTLLKGYKDGAKVEIVK